MFGLFNFWIPLFFIIQVYHLLQSRKSKNLCLLMASWIFYISIDYRVFPILLISTITDYIAGFFVVPKKSKIIRSTALVLSLLINLSLLCFFKYAPDILNTNSISESLLQSIGLPLGISFYTFQTIGYTVDCYRGRIQPTKDVLSFSLYVSFFPQLAAGPIERATKLLPQFQSNITSINILQFREGFYLILLGLFKKIYVGNGLDLPINRIFDMEQTDPSMLFFGGFLGFFYIYVDFSAYSDLARGIAKFFNINLMVNFKPFIFSKDPVDFWRNWHISLYKWIINYPLRAIVYINKTKKHSAIYIFTLMLIFSFWHKISINHFINALFNTFTILITLYFRKKNNHFPVVFKYILIFIIMFIYYSIKGFLHYSDNFEHLISMISKMFEFQGFGRESLDLLIYVFPLLAPLFIYEIFEKKYKTALFILNMPLPLRAFWCSFVLACIFVFERGAYTDFIYFGF